MFCEEYIGGVWIFTTKCDIIWQSPFRKAPWVPSVSDSVIEEQIPFFRTGNQLRNRARRPDNRGGRIRRAKDKMTLANI